MKRDMMVREGRVGLHLTVRFVLFPFYGVLVSNFNGTYLLFACDGILALAVSALSIYIACLLVDTRRPMEPQIHGTP